MVNFENLNKWKFEGVGNYGIPVIQPTTIKNCEWIPFNCAKTAKLKDTIGIHCFVDDYQFLRLWNHPDRYLPLIEQFYCICSPDFSAYSDMPLAMQIYNHYRKHWLAAYWQLHGITVIPTISWSTPNSYDWCFDGEPENSIVAVSSVGTQKSKESKSLFLQGYEEMIKRLNPTEVVFYGNVPEECDWNVRRVEPFYKSIRQRI